ncbi:hypothetical protein ACFXPT_33600 [Streptomyces goshikiensis]|uniref:hypothetical protein n=1 Tax=Streptomyces goshikiensis TaxID=1942 RepID=UPI0036C1D98A
MARAKDDAPPTLVAARERLVADRADALARAAALRSGFDGIVVANALAAIDGKHAPEGGSTGF